MEEDLATIDLELRLHNYLQIIPITFLYWDHSMTFGDEVHFLWRKASSRSTYYFFANRYLAFFGNIVIIVLQFATIPTPWCKSINIFREVFLAFTQILICVLLAIRIYALYGRNKRVYIYLAAVGAVLIGVSCWALKGNNGVPQPNVAGCHIQQADLAVPWVALFIYDVIIFVALFYKSFRMQIRSNMMWNRVPILSLLLRDGACSSVLVICAQISIIDVFLRRRNLLCPLLRGCLSTFASSLSVTMMSRLMLNLHTVERTGIFSTTGTPSVDPSTYEGSADIQLDTLRTRDLERSAHVPQTITLPT
ncbi:hypothetical protein C8J57DRAFT_1312878 [Mycena rebaudengoi]|nr:hypothetical protein C8J57DRAFT_1312878 [Mycena rebaudengoi]